jgi:hypothetical protein
MFLDINVYVIDNNAVCHYVSTCNGMDFNLGKVTEWGQFVNGPDRSSRSKYKVTQNVATFGSSTSHIW